MHQVKEHRGLAEHQEHAVLAGRRCAARSSQSAPSTRKDAQLERRVGERRRVLADMQPLLPRVVGAVQEHVAVAGIPAHDRRRSRGAPRRRTTGPSSRETVLVPAAYRTDVAAEHPAQHHDRQPREERILDDSACRCRRCATVNAASTRGLPGGCQTQPVTISPNDPAQADQQQAPGGQPAKRRHAHHRQTDRQQHREGPPARAERDDRGVHQRDDRAAHQDAFVDLPGSPRP